MRLVPPRHSGIDRSTVVRAAARAAAEPLESRVMLSSYFVSTSGSDAAPGTLEAPLRTIQHAADIAQPGDTVYIRGGTYRETVRPARSGTPGGPITFQPYGDETVTVSGADVVTGWSKHDDSVFRARQGWDLGFGDNQVFVDGRMMTEARWPNTSLDPSHPRLATADAITPSVNGDHSVGILRDAALTQPDGYWDGAVIHIAPGQGWVAQTGRVISSVRGRLVYSYQQMNEQHETPEAGDRYYLTGKFRALDSSGEWYLDAGDDTLYLRTPGSDDPEDHVVEAKRRDYAFDLSGRSNISVDGIRIFAATIATDADSDSIRLTNLQASYVSHHTLMPSGWERPDQTGILLLGTNSLLRDSTIAFSSAHGVTVTGSTNKVENNVIHDIGYAGGDDAGILVRGRGHEITRNTIYNAGRDGIKTSRGADIRVTYNLIHDVMLQTTDGGGIYTYGTDGAGAEFAYNVIHDVKGGGFGGAGVYLDNFSSDYVIHHNVVWDADHALKMNPTSRDNKVFNNTLAGTDYSVATSKSGDMLGSEFRNNLFTKAAKIDPRAERQNNLYAGGDAGFVNLAAGDLRLKPSSRAVDAGVVVDGVGYAGDAPDVGAYELGRPVWTAGARPVSGVRPARAPSPAPRPTPSPSTLPSRDARSRLEAEQYRAQSGVRRGRTIIGYLNSGDWVSYGGLNFGNGLLRHFRARMGVADGWDGKRVELRLDSPTGRLIGALTTTSTGGWNHYRDQSAAVQRTTGVHNLYLVFAGGDGVATIDAFRFE